MRDRGGEGRGGERREGEEETDAREGRPLGMAGDRQGGCRGTAKGPARSTEESRDLMNSAVLMCVHAGRRVTQGRMHSGKGGVHAKKKTTSTAGGRKIQSEQAAGKWEGAHGAEEGPRLVQKEIAGDKVGNMHGYQGKRGWGEEEEPATVPERNTPPKRQGAVRERRRLGAQNGPRTDEDPVGRRQRVAGGPLGYKHGMIRKGDRTEKGVRLGLHDSPRRMGRRGSPGVGRDGRRDVVQEARTGARRERPVLGARNGPRMHEDPVGPRDKVAGGPVGSNHGMKGL